MHPFDRTAAWWLHAGRHFGLSSDANFTTRDRRELANTPYRTASISPAYRRQIVRYDRKEAPGSILVDTRGPFCYYVLPGARRFAGATVGEAGQTWSGVATVERKAEWPGWTPTADESAGLNRFRPTCRAERPIQWPRALLYFCGKDTLYRIHGTNQPEYIGQRFPRLHPYNQ
jgi:lipoprotein-anchoring transpeptidase ErfK/SrfK